MKRCTTLGRSLANVNVATMALNQFHPIGKWNAFDPKTETCQEHDRNDLAECARITLHVDAEQPASTAAWAIKAIARVTYGCGSILSFVEVDFKNGTQLSLPADSIDISVAIIERIGAPVPQHQTFGYVIARGDSHTAGAATRTGPRVIVPNGGFAVIPVPRFAYSVSFVSSASAAFFAATTTVNQSGSGDAAAAILANETGPALTNSPNFNIGWTLVNGARALVVLNGGAAPIDCEPVFFIGV